MVPVEHFYLLSAFLFAIGMGIVISRKNAILVLIGIELILNAANINFVAVSYYDSDIAGQFTALFVIVIAAAEAAVGLAIVIRVFDYFKTIDLDKINEITD